MMLVNVHVVYSVLTSVVFVASYPVGPSSPIVDLGYTQYQGTELANGITQWLGMRYAAPPVGNLRFRTPEDPIPSSGLQIADKVQYSLNLRKLTFCT